MPRGFRTLASVWPLLLFLAVWIVGISSSSGPLGVLAPGRRGNSATVAAMARTRRAAVCQRPLVPWNAFVSLTGLLGFSPFESVLAVVRPR